MLMTMMNIWIVKMFMQEGTMSMQVTVGLLMMPVLMVFIMNMAVLVCERFVPE